MEQLESTLLSLNDSRIYRRTVGSIVGSCVLAVTPLLVSVMQDASLVALDIIESIGSGPREPWHDLHCRIDGPAAYDILTNFEQRWKKAAKWRDLRLGKARHWHDDTLLKIERLSFILTPYLGPDGDQVVHVTTEEDPENWHVQVFLSIDSRSVKGFPKGVKEAEAQIHHIATHLLQAALKKVIGQETSQAGLLAAFDRLRFDFNFHRPLIDNEVMQIESLINRWIGDAALLQTKVMPIAEAKRAGAIATFGEKYGDQVKAEEVTTRVDALLEELRMAKNEVSKIRAKAAVYKASIIAGKAVTVGSSKEISYEPKAAITGVIHDYVPYKSSSMERAQEVQANLLPELPSFAKPMLPSHVAGGFWL